MFDNSISMFRLVAIGTAAENKSIKTTKLHVTPHEKLQFLDGELATNVDTMEYEGPDASGVVKAGKAFIGTTIQMEWLPETNRLKTPPSVRRGERIGIYQFASNDKYYWRSLGLDDHLRRLETIIIAINANPTEDGQDPDDPANYYLLEMSSHNKTITLQTSQRNGEFCTYGFQFDLVNGKVVLEDNVNNHFLFDSKNHHFEFKNALGTHFEMNKKNIRGYAPDNIYIRADKNIQMSAGKEIMIDAPTSVTIKSGGTVQRWSPGGTTLKTPKFEGSS